MASERVAGGGYNKQMAGEQGPGSISRNLDQLEDESETQTRGKYIADTPRQPFPRELDALGDESGAPASWRVSFCGCTQEGSRHLLSVRHRDPFLPCRE